MDIKLPKFSGKKLTSIVVLLTFVFSFFFSLLVNPFVVNAATLTTGSVTLTDSRPSTASTSYSIQFSGVSLSAIKCIQLVFSTAATGGSVPTALTTTSATLDNTATNFIPTPASWAANVTANGTVKITFATGETPASASSRVVEMDVITNGSTANTAYYVQFSTYNNIDCATTPVDSGVATFIYTAGVVVSASVDPTLTFTVNAVASGQTVNGATTNIVSTATTVPLGTVTTSTNGIGAQDLTVSTNAAGGYVVTIKYTGALASAGSNWTNHTGSNATPTTFPAAGVTEAFGYTTASTSLPGTAARFSPNKWAAFTTTALSNAVAAKTTSATAETTRIGYQASIVGSTPAGSYTTTVVLIATATY